MQDAPPDSGLCVTPTMAKFQALSPAEQRLHLEAHPQQVGRVDRVALVEGALLATVQHWPKATEVVGMQLMDLLARTPGMQLSILMGKVTKSERALLATPWPGVLWMSMPDVVNWYRQEILPKGGDHELQIAGFVLGHIRWGTP